MYLKVIKILSVALIASAALIFLFFGTELFGHSQYIEESGSMVPKIAVGSIVLVEKSNTYGVGDIITFKTPGDSGTTTHRIVKVEHTSGGTAFQVKGDANNAPDPGLVPEQNVIGKVYLSIPYLGYVVGWIKSLPGLIAFILVPATIIIYQEFALIFAELGAARSDRRRQSLKPAAKRNEAKIEQQDLIGGYLGLQHKTVIRPRDVL